MYTCKQNKHSLLLEDAGEPIRYSEKLQGKKIIAYAHGTVCSESSREYLSWPLKNQRILYIYAIKKKK